MLVHPVLLLAQSVCKGQLQSPIIFQIASVLSQVGAPLLFLPRQCSAALARPAAREPDSCKDRRRSLHRTLIESAPPPRPNRATALRTLPKASLPW